MAFEFLINLIGEAQARVIHRQQEPFDFKRRIEL